jgi:hypothetical protein
MKPPRGRLTAVSARRYLVAVLSPAQAPVRVLAGAAAAAAAQAAGRAPVRVPAGARAAAGALVAVPAMAWAAATAAVPGAAAATLTAVAGGGPAVAHLVRAAQVLAVLASAERDRRVLRRLALLASEDASPLGVGYPGTRAGSSRSGQPVPSGRAGARSRTADGTLTTRSPGTGRRGSPLRLPRPRTPGRGGPTRPAWWPSRQCRSPTLTSQRVRRCPAGTRRTERPPRLRQASRPLGHVSPACLHERFPAYGVRGCSLAGSEMCSATVPDVG